MTIEQQVTAILSIVNAQTTAITSLAAAVASIPTPAGSAPADNTTVLAAIADLAGKVTDIQSQLEDPAPAPAPEPAPAA